jgi:hypothetical protein
MAGRPELTYPPNQGFLPDEAAAVDSIPRTPAMERALRKLIASAAAKPIFHLLCLADGVTEAPPLEDVQDRDETAVEIMLHDRFGESYWAWRRCRPDAGWRLDVYKGE